MTPNPNSLSHCFQHGALRHTGPGNASGAFDSGGVVGSKMRELEEKPSQWHEGTALGSVVGELRKLDDFEHDREFVIVPAVGDPVFCKFPPSMDDEMGGYWRKIVKVSGVLHYKASSPFPESVDVSDGGIELYATTRPRRTLREMRGVFAGRERAAINWGDLLDG